MKRSQFKLICVVFAVLLCLSVIPMTAFAQEQTSEDDLPVSNGLVMTPGASIRTSEDYGIRFEATITKDFLATWGEENVTEAGMLVAPTAYLGSSEFSEEALAEGQYLRVKSSGYAVENENGKSYRVALVGFPKTKEAVLKQFSARAYVVVKDAQGGEKMWYSSYDSGNARSLYDVAKACDGLDEFKDNEVIQSILAFADYSCLKNSDTVNAKDFVQIDSESFEFKAAVTTDAASHLDDLRVQANLPIKVGQQVEFDYTWLATNSTGDQWGDVYFWLKDSTASFHESIFSTMKLTYLKNGDAQKAGFGTDEYVNVEHFTDGANWDGANGGKWMHWDIAEYHIVISVLPAVNGSNPQICYTITELTENEPRGYTQTVIAKQAELSNLSLVFGSKQVSYRISNLTVKEIPSMFTYINWFDVNYDLVTFGKNSFTYKGDAAYMDEGNANWHRRQCYVSANVPLSIGQKIEFDYQFEKGGGYGNAWMWIKSANKPFTGGWDQMQATDQANATLNILYFGNGSTARVSWNNIVHKDPGEQDQISLRSNAKWHITMEILSGSDDSKVLFRCTMTEMGVENPATCTWEFENGKAGISDDMTLVFGTMLTSYTVSNLQVSAIEP